MKSLYRQFGNPHGLLGRIAGSIMARRSSNIERGDWALSLLDLNVRDRVLEIGFGPGVAISKCASRVAETVGIDRSDLMVRTATKRGRDLIEQGKLKLVVGSIESSAFELGSFDKIYSINVVQFWDDPVAVFREIRKSLKPHGLLTTVYMPRHKGATDADAFDEARKIEDWLREAGYAEIEVQTKAMKPVATIAVLARQ